MRINEVVYPEDMVRMIELIFSNTLAQIRRSHQVPNSQASIRSVTPAPVSRVKTNPQIPKKPLVKKVAAKPIIKKAPYAAPPKPLPKSNPQPNAQAKLQVQNQQQFASQIAKAMQDKASSKLPKSLQPLPTSITNPIGGPAAEFEKKLELARREAQ